MLKTVMEKILVVGSGMTGAAVASLLRQDVQRAAAICVWDKSNGIGGRMSTSRCNRDGRCTVDLGAQYISASPEYQKSHAREYRELLDAGVLTEIHIGDIAGHQDRVKGMLHYVAPDGINSLVKHFIHKADVELGKGHLVTDVSIATDKVKVTTDKGQSDQFDAIVITMPVPQILQLQGDIAKLMDEKQVRPCLKNVSYSSRFAVGLYYAPNTQIDVQWSAKYITDNPCIRYVAIDNRRRGKVSDDFGPSICVHTSAPWGIENVERDKDDVAREIVAQLPSVLPGLPEPVEVKGHKWRYSQVHKSYEGSPGCFVLSEKPLIVLAGDAFTHSNFDGCLESALAVQRTFNQITRSKV